MANYIVVSGARDNWSMGQLLKREGFTGGFGNTEADGSFGVPLGETDAATTHSFLATRHMAKFGTTSEQLGAIAVQQRQWANMNPLAQMYHKPMTLEDHQKSPILVWPYHRNDMAVQSDAAIAVVITTDDRARDLKRKPVRLKGIGFDDATKEQWWSGPGNYESLPVAEAKKTAFGMAEIGIEDLSMAQLYDCFTGEVLVQLEDYGFCKKGEGGPFAAEGHLGPGGKMPCNTSGGLLSAYHMGDLTGIAESVTQLRGEAGERQVAKSNFSLVTGHGGELLSPGLCSTHSALILGV
jgi:acetyl-CoA acetyltransferase